MAVVNPRHDDNDLALTGIPRGGTTLACRLLGQATGCVALFEPIDPARIPPTPAAAIEFIAGFFRQARASLLENGTAPSKQHDGQVPDNPFPDPAPGARELLATPGMLRPEPPPQPGFTLAIKHNASFAALLPGLSNRIRTIAIVRNPLAVLASWNSVPLPVRDGRLPAGERLDPGLRAKLAEERETDLRQLAILHWFFDRFETSLPPGQVVRYEDIIASGGKVLHACAGLEGAPDPHLRERDAGSAYQGVDVGGQSRRLLDAPGSWRRWYGDDEVAALARRMAENGIQ